MAVSKEWHNLKSFLRKTYNREVNEWFADEPEDVPDNSTSRKQAKRACIVRPKESQNMALIKMLNFRYQVQQVHLRPDVFGIDMDSYNESFVYRPQVKLYFQQDAAAVSSGRRAVEGELTFRLPNETSATMTKAKAKAIALKIKQEFATANGYVWKKGKYKVVYKDPEYGIDSRILALSEAEGIEVIKKLLDVVGAVYDDDKCNVVNPKKDSESNPTGTELVYGRQQKKTRWRPTANCRFQYAVLTIHKLQYRLILVDRSKKYLNALEWT